MVAFANQCEPFSIVTPSQQQGKTPMVKVTFIKMIILQKDACAVAVQCSGTTSTVTHNFVFNIAHSPANCQQTGQQTGQQTVWELNNRKLK